LGLLKSDIRVWKVGYPGLESRISEFGKSDIRVWKVRYPSLESQISEFGKSDIRVWKVGYPSLESRISEINDRKAANNLRQSAFVCCSERFNRRLPQIGRKSNCRNPCGRAELCRGRAGRCRLQSVSSPIWTRQSASIPYLAHAITPLG